MQSGNVAKDEELMDSINLLKRFFECIAPLENSTLDFFSIPKHVGSYY